MSTNSGEFFANRKKTSEVVKSPFKLNRPVVKNNSLADVGIEFELEGRGLPTSGHFGAIVGKTSKSFWERKTDGSLRDGYEYVLATPCKENEISEMVQKFYDVLENNGVRLNLTNRCSTHVHLNVGGYKINELTSLLTMWYVFETALIEWCGEERKSNHFCLSHKETNQLSDVWFNYLTNGRRKFPRMKYSALNVLTLDTFGSVEFRCGPAFENAENAINWIKFLREMQNTCKAEFSCPSHIAYALSERGPEEILRQICSNIGIPGFANQVLAANTGLDFEGECMRGFRSFQKNTLGFPWEEWSTEINKEYVPDPFEKTPKPSQRNRVTELATAVDAVRRNRFTTQPEELLRTITPETW